MLSFYFSPDLSAGSFRSSSLVKSLLSDSSGMVEVFLITTSPNRYSSFNETAPKIEKTSNLTIHRIKILKHNNLIFGQFFAFLTYFRGVLKLVNNNDFDLIYATSSRLMTATLGTFIAKKLKKPLYLDIRDIFTETVNEALPKMPALILKPFFCALERYSINHATKVNLVSRGFLPYFEKRYQNQNFEIFPNGIDEEFLNAQPKSYAKSYSKVLTVVYAGNIGQGQGLHKIIPQLAKKFQGVLFFKIIGDGACTSKLTSVIKKMNCKNIVVISPIIRNQLIDTYKSADILFLHLNDYDAFKKVLPSKLFEYAVMGKPIWAGVSGYAAEFLQNNVNNSAVFMPCNLEEATSSFYRLKLETQPRDAFVFQYSRSKIMKKMAEDIIQIGQNKY